MMTKSFTMMARPLKTNPI